MNTFLSEQYGIVNESLTLAYYISLPFAFILIILLIYQTIRKITAIKHKDSYSLISIWINYISIVNLSNQLILLLFQSYHIL